MEGGQGRTYRYFTGRPQWEFGYGLSYSSFSYSELSVSPVQPNTTQDVKVTVKVKNTGRKPGGEVCELYLSHANPGLPAPLRSLQGFARIELNPGEEKKVTYTLTPQQLSLVDGDGKRWVMPGQIKLHVGGNQCQGTEALLILNGDKTKPVYRFVPPVVQ